MTEGEEEGELQKEKRKAQTLCVKDVCEDLEKHGIRKHRSVQEEDYGDEVIS